MSSCNAFLPLQQLRYRVGTTNPLGPLDTLGGCTGILNSLGRSALLMAIDNENLEMVELLLDNKVSNCLHVMLSSLYSSFVVGWGAADPWGGPFDPLGGPLSCLFVSRVSHR